MIDMDTSSDELQVSGSEDLSKSTVFDLLTNDRRRQMLYYLEENQGSASLTRLAKHIASEEIDVPMNELSSQQHKRVYVSLYQTHVPKLESFGVIEYHPESRTVELRDASSLLYFYLHLDPRKEDATDTSAVSGIVERFRSSFL